MDLPEPLAPSSSSAPPGSTAAEFLALCDQHGIATERLGEVTDLAELEVVGRFILALAEVRARWAAPLREAMAAG